MKLNKRYKSKAAQAYAPTSSHAGQPVESFYDDVKSAINKLKTQYNALMRDINAKGGKKQPGNREVGEEGIVSRNKKLELLVEFVERNNLRIMNTFYRKRENRKRSWKRSNDKTKNEINFKLCAHTCIVQDADVLGKVRCRDYRMVRSPIKLGLRRERKKLVRKKPMNELAVRGKIEDFRISLQNRNSALTHEDELRAQAKNENFTNTINECAIEVGAKVFRQDTGKLSQETKDLIKKHQSMKASNPMSRL